MAGYLPRNRGNRSTDRTGAVVSRRLRAAGFNISPAARKHKANGIFVSGYKGGATVLVDLGRTGANRATATDIFDRVADWPQVSDLDMRVVGESFIFVQFSYNPIGRNGS